MKPQRAVLRETGRIAAGVAALVAVMLGVYAVVGQFNARVLLGGVYSGVLAVANFFFMGLTIQSITDEAGERQRTDQEIEALTTRMKARMQTSSTIRKFALLALLVLGITVFKFDALATLLPILFPRLVILFLQITGKTTSKGSESP